MTWLIDKEHAHMVHPLSSGKNIVIKIVNYLRNNGGTAVLNSQLLGIDFDCDSSHVLWSIRKLKSCGIITPIDPYGRGHRNSRFSLANEFMTGENWQEALKNYASLIDQKNNIATRLVSYLQSMGGKAIINGKALSKEWGTSQPGISSALRSLIKQGLVATTGSTGSGIRNVEFFLTEANKGQPSEQLTARNGIRLTSNNSDGDIALKLSISRELVQVYERLNESQKLVIQLQLEKDKLQSRISELEKELQQERSHRAIDANDIATLELQLRELRQITDINSRRVMFDRRGIQS